MSTTPSIEYHLNRSKQLFISLVKNFAPSFVVVIRSPFTYWLINLHWVKKPLLVVHNLVDAWSFCQLIHQVLSAQYGHLQVQCIMTKRCAFIA